jgi:hypothetical protein
MGSTRVCTCSTRLNQAVYWHSEQRSRVWRGEMAPLTLAFDPLHRRTQTCYICSSPNTGIRPHCERPALVPGSLSFWRSVKSVLLYPLVAYQTD